MPWEQTCKYIEFYCPQIRELQINLNNELNNLSMLLSQKGITLIVLPSPDKYGVYYEFIQNKANYPRPLFFDQMDGMEKDYIYINSKKILTNAVNNKRDIYFFDDTHWSPWGSKLIARELATIISSNNKSKTHKTVFNQ